MTQDLSVPKTELISRPSQDVVSALKLLLCIPEDCSPTTKAVVENWNVHHDLSPWMGTRDSKIQDGEDVDVFRSPDYEEVPRLIE